MMQLDTLDIKDLDQYKLEDKLCAYDISPIRYFRKVSSFILSKLENFNINR